MSFLSQNALPILSLLGGIFQSTAQIQQGRREAELFEYNASVQRQQAQLIVAKRTLDLERQRKQARSFISAQNAVIGASGVRNTGSPLEVVRDTTMELILDAQYITFNSQMEEFRALTGAELSLMKAQQARNAGFIKAGSTMLSMIPTLSKFRFGTGSTGVDTSGFTSRFDLGGQLTAESGFATFG